MDTQKIHIVVASDHAGFEIKNVLMAYLKDKLGYDVEDVGAHVYDKEDDYPDFISLAAKQVSEHPDSVKAIILGGSGQAEAIVANRFPRVRAAVYYGHAGTQKDIDGNVLDMIASTREHNNANILSLGARFLSEEEAKEAVATWLQTAFSEAPRHVRRIKKIEERYS